MGWLFISDLHLAASRPAVTERFLRFLAGPAASAERLYILGDLFDVWVGDDDQEDPIPQVQEQLACLTASGAQVLVMHGNRDFLLGQDFVSATGVKLLQDPVTVDLGGQTTLLTHGDQLCTDDLTYQAARLQLRHPKTIENFLARPLAERRMIAAEYRRRSGEATSLKAADIMDVNARTVADWLGRHGACQLIHGHTHRPGSYPLELAEGEAMRHVLPDWREEGAGYLAFEDGTLSALDC